MSYTGFKAALISVTVTLLMSLWVYPSAVSQSSGQPKVYINFTRFTDPASKPWNNLDTNPATAGLMVENLKDSEGKPTKIDVHMVAPTTYPFSKTPNDQLEVDGVYPDEVLWRAWGSKKPWAFKLSQLQPNYSYTLSFFSSQRSYEGDNVLIELNGIQVLYEKVRDNKQRLLKLSVKSDAQGEILIKLKKMDGSLSSLAALVIEDAKDNYFEPKAYEGEAIALASPKPVRKPAPVSKNNGSYYSSSLVNPQARISKARLVSPDPNPSNHAIEMYGGYQVDWRDPGNKSLETANVHDPESAWRTDDVKWEGGKLAGIKGSKPEYYFKQRFQDVKQPWKDLSAYYYMNRETRLDTVVFYQMDNRPINPGATCNFWYSLYGSTDNFNWTRILDSLSFDRSGRWKGYLTGDPNYYCYLRLKIESSDPNMYYDCKTNSSLIKIVASGQYRGGKITTFMDPAKLPSAVEKKNTFNSFFGTNCFNSDPDSLRAQFGLLRAYMSYGDFSNELGGKFFINQSTNGEYNTHYNSIKHKGDDGKAVRWLKNNIIYRNQKVKELNPDAKIIYCIQQGANWHINQKAKAQGGWYYHRDLDKDKKVDYPEEFFPYSTTSYLLKGPAGIGARSQRPEDIGSIEQEYRVNPQGYEKASEVLEYWTQDGQVSPWISSYFDLSDPEQPHTQKYSRGMRVPWYKHKALADPTKRDSVLSDPRTYAYDATFFYNLTAVHGPNEVDLNTLWVQPGQVEKTGYGVMDMLEWENETDQTWHGPMAHMWPQWAGAYMSAIMDGNMGQIPGPHGNYITGYMCAAPLLDFLYQGTTKDGCYDIKLALDALVAIRTKRKKELNDQGITTHPGNGMPLYILPPNFWANWHHYSGTSGGQRSAQYLRFPGQKDEKGLTATDDDIYQTVREETAWLKSFYPEVRTIITEWGYGTHTGGKFSPLKDDFAAGEQDIDLIRDSLKDILEDRRKAITNSSDPDQGALAKIDRELGKLKKMEALAIPNDAGMFHQQANWLVRGSLELWFSGLDGLTQYWLSDKGSYYDIFTYNEELERLMPDHQRKWYAESRNDFTTFTGMGLYGNPRFGHGGYPPKTSAYAFHNLKRLMGESVAIRRAYLNEGEKIKSFLSLDEATGYYNLVIFKATAQNLVAEDFEVLLPEGAHSIQLIDFVVDSYSPSIRDYTEGQLILDLGEKPMLVRFKL